MGVGFRLRKLAVEPLSKALRQIAFDEQMKAKATILGERLRNEDGVKNAINFIYRDLDYARIRIKQIAANHK